jgi:hypothetical protein
MKYNVIGSNVNLSSRIESLTTGGQLLISDSTFSAVGAELSVLQTIKFHPKGIPNPISVYNIGAIGAPFNLSVHESVEQMKTLSVPVPIFCRIIRDKQVDTDGFPFLITAISKKGALLSGEAGLEIFDNIKLEVNSLYAIEIFAKVTDMPDDGMIKIRFTMGGAEIFSAVTESNL